MFYINSERDKPDIDGAFEYVKECIDGGIEIHDLTDLKKKLNVAYENAADELKFKYGIQNPNRVQEIRDYLIALEDELVTSKCYDPRTQKWTTKAPAMAPLAIAGLDFAKDLLSFRKVSGLLKGVNQISNAQVYADKRIRPTAALQKTNRIGFSDPPLLSIPKDILWHVIAPREPDRVIYSVDIKFQEPQIIINMLDIETLKPALTDPRGLYEGMFYRLFGHECNPKERAEFKTAWIALTYGGNEYTLNNICRHIDAKEVYKKFKSLKEYTSYRGACYGLAKKNVQVRNTYFGTKVSANITGPRLSRVLMDIPIQGTGADILALLIMHFLEEVEELGLERELFFYFPRSDELILEVTVDLLEELGEEKVISILTNILEHKVDDWEPFKVKIERKEKTEIALEYSYEDALDELDL